MLGLASMTKRGRPSKGIVGEKTNFSANLYPELAKALREESEQSGVPIAEIVRRAVEAYLGKKRGAR